MPDFRERFLAFVAEQHPYALGLVTTAFDRVTARTPVDDAGGPEALRAPLTKAIATSSKWPKLDAGIESTPGVAVEVRLQQASDALVAACDGFLRREAIAASLTSDERRELLRGMVLTRALDNRLKQFFAGSEVRYGSTPFQGKGFRSLGQEAIYARRDPPSPREGVSRGRRHLARRRHRSRSFATSAPRSRCARSRRAIRMVLSAQMGKAGPPMDGRDLHVGDFDWGVLPASAPLAISSLTVAGMGLAFARLGGGRIAVSFIGEGGSSLGEWHEAINLCAARRLPVVFCLQNNQTALSTPVADQSAVRVFADKAAGYGMPGVTIDGTDPEAIAAAFAWAAERARAGQGPALIELVAMRMCGHAHHDDMLYLGKEPPASWEYPPLTPQGYADPDATPSGATRDPIPAYAPGPRSARVDRRRRSRSDEARR